MLDERSHRSTFASEFYLWLLATNKIFKSECNQLKRSPFNQCSIQIQATGRPSATAAQLVRSKVEETTLRSFTCTRTCSKRLKGGGRRGRRRRRRLHGGGEGSSAGGVAWLSTWPMERGRMGAGEGGGHPRLFGQW